MILNYILTRFLIDYTQRCTKNENQKKQINHTGKLKCRLEGGVLGGLVYLGVVRV